MTDGAAAAHAPFANEFRIGQVITTSLEVFSRHIAIFTLIAGVVVLPVVLAVVLTAGGAPDAVGIGVLIGVVLYLFLTPLATAVILYGAFQAMRGHPVRLGDSVSNGLARFLPLVGVMIVQGLGILAASLLFFIPGVIVAVMWYVAVPICVVEKIGPIDSLSRSQHLTKGVRWKVFGLLLFAYVIGILVESVLPVVGSLLAGYWGQFVLQLISQGLSLAFSSVLIVVAYYNLRVAKEGMDIEAIASVFD